MHPTKYPCVVQVAAEADVAAEVRSLKDAADLAKQRVGQLEEHNKTLLDQLEAAALQRSSGEASGVPGCRLGLQSPQERRLGVSDTSRRPEAGASRGLQVCQHQNMQLHWVSCGERHQAGLGVASEVLWMLVQLLGSFRPDPGKK